MEDVKGGNPSRGSDANQSRGENAPGLPCPWDGGEEQTWLRMMSQEKREEAGFGKALED